ncbi:MAG: GtrA family protein [Chloroflexi bacterium]|nr:GtrA family protein [Chloroflexota bacterium]
MWQSRRVAGWVVLGAAAALVELGLLRVLYELLGWPLPLATAVAAEVLILGKFGIADRWVFGHPWPTWDRLLRYHGASAGALVVYWLVINGLAEWVGLQYVVAFVLGTGAAFTWSLFTNFLWVWSKPAPAHEHSSADRSA